MMTTDNLMGTILENMISRSDFGILNRDSQTKLPSNPNPYSPDVSLASASLVDSTILHSSVVIYTGGVSIFVLWYTLLSGKIILEYFKVDSETLFQ